MPVAIPNGFLSHLGSAGSSQDGCAIPGILLFQHSKPLQIYPESLTASVQKQILNVETVHQTENRLPLIYKLREKKPVNTFPFSVHDNRHCLLNVGEYLDSGLGLRKFQRESCQHYAQNFSFLAHEPILSDTSYCTIYQTSFVPYPNTEQPFPGRFPKSHVERSNALNPVSKNDCIWFSDCYTNSNNLVPDGLVTSTLPNPKELPDTQLME